MARKPTKRLVAPDVQKAIVRDYQAGALVTQIENQYDVNRPTLYWVLEQNGVLPARSHRGARLAGSTEQLDALLDHIGELEEHIGRLNGLLRKVRPHVGESLQKAIDEALSHEFD